MLVNGGVELISSFGVISGMDNDPSVEYIGDISDMYEFDDSMSGVDDLSIISGEDYEGSDMGYMDEGTMSGTDFSIISGSDEDYDY